MDLMAEDQNIERLRARSVSLLVEHGLPVEDASILVDTLLDADINGVSTHGIRMLPVYVEKIDKGIFKPGKIKIVRASPVFTVLDAGNSIGAVSARKAATIAIERAKAAGIHVVFARNCNTFGAASYYADLIAKDGLIGLAFCNAPAAMPAYNGAEPLLGTNPLAFACRSKSYGTLSFDFATSTAAKSKFQMLKQAGKTLPEGWALDRDGKPTTDPDEGIHGLVMPMAGFKGYGLAVMIDIVSGLLSGAGYLNKVHKFYGDQQGMDAGQCFVALDPSQIYEGDFGEEMDKYISILRSSRTIGQEPIVVPGDRKTLARQKHIENGIPLPKETAEKLELLFSGGGK